MTGIMRLSAIERAAKIRLEAEGYAVVPMRQCFVSRNKPVHLMALRNTTQLLYLKLKKTLRPLPDVAAVERFCLDDILILRRLFPLSPGSISLCFEIWILRDTGSFACYEVFAEGIREVSHV